MAEYRRVRPRDGHERVFRALLLLYPRAFRDEVGDAMVEFFRDRIADARAAHGTLGIAAAWGAVLRDTLREAPLSHLDAARRAASRLTTPPPPAAAAARRKDWMLSTILRDARYALRGVLRSPGFSALVVATLALGMGANAAIFSVVNGVLLRPLPFADPERLVRVDHLSPYQTVSEPEFADYRRRSRTLQRVAAYAFSSPSLTAPGEEPERLLVARVTDGFFETLGVSALVGRTFTAEEERSGGPGAVLLSHGFWQRRYGGDRSIVGRQVILNGVSRTVVGVMPPAFRFPEEDVAIWSPMRLRYDSLWTRNNHYLLVIARLAAGARPEQVRAELNAMTRQWMTEYPDVYPPDQPLVAAPVPLRDAVIGRARPFLLSLVGAVGFVLLIACVNVANLLLVRGEARRKELAIRSALGASRARLVRQGLTESLVYSLAGAAGGLAVAYWGVRGLLALAPADVPRLENVAIDAAVLAVTTAVAVLTGIAFGVAPSLLAAREDTSETLKEGGKTSTAAARGAGRTRRRLVTAEISLALITVCGAGLMVRSLIKLQAVDLGFAPDHLLAMRVTPPAAPDSLEPRARDERAAAFYEAALARMRALPGISSAAAVQDLPVVDGFSSWSILVDGAAMTSVANAPAATPEAVTPDYFRTMQIAVIRGRTFTDADRADAPLVAVVNETMARQLWPDRDAVGGTIKMLAEEMPWVTVVGVVQDVKSAGVTSEPPPTMYFPHAQAGRSAWFVPPVMNIVLRTSGDPTPLAAASRAVLRELEPNAPVSRVGAMEQLVAGSVGARRFSTLLLTIFAGLALVLAGIGIYGVISSSVAQRSFEIGVRLALGASRRDVVRMVLADGLRTAAIGSAVGVVGALAATSLLRAVFFEVDFWDPASFGGAVVLLFLVVLAASTIPAARASAVDPIGSLRAE